MCPQPLLEPLLKLKKEDDLPRAFSSRLFSWPLPPPGFGRFPLGHVLWRSGEFDWLRFHNELGHRYSVGVPFGAVLATVLILHDVLRLPLLAADCVCKKVHLIIGMLCF